MLYTLTVSGAELDVIRLAIGRMTDAKPVKIPSPRKAPVAFVATGPAPWQDTHPLDADSAAWIEAHHSASFVAKRPTIAAPAPLKPRLWSQRDKNTLEDFNERAISSWRALGHEVVVDGGLPRGDGANVHVLPLRVFS